MEKACGDGLPHRAAAGKVAQKRPVGRLLAGALAVGIATALGTAPAAAADLHRLTADGARLGTLETAGPVSDLRFTVALDGDVPESTHVWASIGGSGLRQRTNEGYWVPWNGDPGTLVDNGFTAKDGAVEFKVLDEDVSEDNHGITIAVGYRAGGVLKYGVFGILPAHAGAGQ